MADKPLPKCEFDPKHLDLHLDVKIAGDPSKVETVVDGIMSVVKGTDCAEGKEFEVELALREALVNAIVHGCESDPDKTVEVCVACDERRGMIIVVRDPGSGFDPAKIPSPIVGENLYSNHGRGIYLINQLMDDVRIGRGGTEIWMRKR